MARRRPQAHRPDAVVELLTQRLFIRADTELNSHDRSPTVREVMDRTASTLGGWLEGQPDVEAQVREAIGGDLPLVPNDFEPAADKLPLGHQAGRVGKRAESQDRHPRHQPAGDAAGPHRQNRRRRAAAPPKPGRLPAQFLGADDPTSLDAAERFGSVLSHAGRLDEAETVLRQSVADRTRVFTSRTPQHAPNRGPPARAPPAPAIKPYAPRARSEHASPRPRGATTPPSFRSRWISQSRKAVDFSQSVSRPVVHRRVRMKPPVRRPETHAGAGFSSLP